jgi:hypothetical protein
VQSTILSCRCACCTFSSTAQTARFVGNPSVTRPNGQRRVRCGLPVIQARSLYSLPATALMRVVSDCLTEASTGSGPRYRLHLDRNEDESNRSVCRCRSTADNWAGWVHPTAKGDAVMAPLAEKAISQALAKWRTDEGNSVWRDRDGRGVLVG